MHLGIECNFKRAERIKYQNILKNVIYCSSWEDLFFTKDTGIIFNTDNDRNYGRSMIVIT